MPLVELRTTNHIRHYTDSNGIVAYYEPGLMDQEVYFQVRSPGYVFPGDGPGRCKLRVARGGSAVLKMKRLNLAERLYRVTGEGIYRDKCSCRPGASTPLSPAEWQSGRSGHSPGCPISRKNLLVLGRHARAGEAESGGFRRDFRVAR